MCRLDFTADLVIVRFLLQSRDLSIGQYDAFSGDFLLKCLQPLTEVLQIVSLPYRAHAVAGDKDAFLHSSLLIRADHEPGTQRRTQ